MYHLKVAAGLDFDDVQLTVTVSPILYLDCPPVILGPSVGRTVIKNKSIKNNRYQNQHMSLHQFLKFPVFVKYFAKAIMLLCIIKSE